MDNIKKDKKDTSHYYVNNKEMLEEFRNYKNSGSISEKLGKMFMDIATNMSNRWNFIGYTWKEDMINEAILTCVKYSKNFDPDKSNNPYGYVSRICYNSFQEYIKKQKRHGDIKETLYNNKDMVNNDLFYSYSSIDYTSLLDIEEGCK